MAILEKKGSILYILDILRKYTDKDHLLNYNEILSILYDEYDITLDRKTVASNIAILTEFGFDINKHGNYGVYLGLRDFEEGELRFLIDAIYSSRSMPTRYAKELVEKLTRDHSIYDKKRYKYLEKIDDGSRTDNKQLFLTIEILDEAISKGKKVKFNYNEYSSKKEMQPRFKGKQFLISPYFMVNSRGRYYLVCNYDKYNDISNYKIECISNISIVDEPIKPISTLDNSEAISKENYINEHIYMTFGKSVDTTIKVENPKYINELIDWFGDTFQVANPVNSECIVRLRVNEQALIYWALQYGEHFEILKPAETREKIKEQIEILNKKYERKE